MLFILAAVISILVPIRVGMIPQGAAVFFKDDACPHTRGDDPKIFYAFITDVDLSPYAWG